jgi:hypothetical protein
MSSPGHAHAVETPLHPLLDAGMLYTRRFLADHAVVNPLGAPHRTLLELILVHQQANDHVQVSADVLRLHQLTQRVQAHISAVQISLLLLQAQHLLGFSDLRLHVPTAGLNQPWMFTSNPLTIPRWPNVSSYATARPAVPQSTNQQLHSYTKSTDSIPTDAAGHAPIQQSMYDNKTVSNECRAVSVANDDAPKKRRREVSASDINDSCKPVNNDSGNGSKRVVRFSTYQEGLWQSSFDELRRYRDRTGKCFVPRSYSQNQALAQWVKRQRYQFKLMVDGKPSLMTEERANALEEIGFVWCSQDSTWSQRLEELKEFRGIFTHCNVPSNYQENPLLANWVRSQRYHYRLYREGKSSQMTVQRICDLEHNGFEWVLRLRQKKSSS